MSQLCSILHVDVHVNGKRSQMHIKCILRTTYSAIFAPLALHEIAHSIAQGLGTIMDGTILRWSKEQHEKGPDIVMHCAAMALRVISQTIMMMWSICISMGLTSKASHHRVPYISGMAPGHSTASVDKKSALHSFSLYYFLYYIKFLEWFALNVYAKDEKWRGHVVGERRKANRKFSRLLKSFRIASNHT